MSSDLYPDDVLKSPVFIRIKGLAEWQSKTPPNEAATTHEGNLSRQLLALLTSCDETIDTFGEKIGLSGGERSQIMSGAFTTTTTPKVVAGLEKMAPALSKALTRHRIEWVSIRAGEAKKLAERTRKAAEHLHTLIKESNVAGTDVSVVTEPQRVQLIALLEALLAELKGNYAERGRHKSIGVWFARILKQGASKGIEDGVTKAIAVVGEAISDFLRGTTDAPKSDVPDDEE